MKMNKFERRCTNFTSVFPQRPRLGRAAQRRAGRVLPTAAETPFWP